MTKATIVVYYKGVFETPKIIFHEFVSQQKTDEETPMFAARIKKPRPNKNMFRLIIHMYIIPSFFLLFYSPRFFFIR